MYIGVGSPLEVFHIYIMLAKSENKKHEKNVRIAKNASQSTESMEALALCKVHDVVFDMNYVTVSGGRTDAE